MPHGKPAAAESGSTLSHRSREARRWAAESCEWRLTGSVSLPEAPHASYVNSYFVVHACMLVCVPRRSVPVSTQPSAANAAERSQAVSRPVSNDGSVDMFQHMVLATQPMSLQALLLQALSVHALSACLLVLVASQLLLCPVLLRGHCMVEASASMSLALPCVHNPCCMSQCARRTGLTQHMCCRLGVCCCAWLSCRVLVAGLSSLQTQCCSLGQPPAAKQAQAWAVLPESPLVAKPWSKGTDVAMGCGMVAPAGGAQQSGQDTCVCTRPLLQRWASSAWAHTQHTG
jgi:hypothetical protein